MTQIIIVAKDTSTLNTHIISEFSKLNKSKHRKNVHFEINFNKKKIVYHIDVKVSDECAMLKSVCNYWNWHTEIIGSIFSRRTQSRKYKSNNSCKSISLVLSSYRWFKMSLCRLFEASWIQYSAFYLYIQVYIDRAWFLSRAACPG